MNKREVFQKGKKTGYDIARENLYQLDRITYTEEDVENFISEMVEHECEIYRQVSPFEFFASELNEARNSEALWDAYESGVDAGIRQVVDEFRKGEL